MRMRALCAAGLAMLLTACATTMTGTKYSRADAGRPWIVQEATVVQVNEATIEGVSSERGLIGGGLIGYSLGHAVGDGAGSAIAGAVAGVAGALVGEKVEKAATQQKAWEILVDIGNGAERLAIVQPADQTFSAGEKVRVYTRSDGSARVAKL